MDLAARLLVAGILLASDVSVFSLTCIFSVLKTFPYFFSELLSHLGAPSMCVSNANWEG